MKAITKITKIIEIDENFIDENLIKIAAAVINNSGLVVFPTETVYGLGANALDPVAVGKIFAAKGRPSDNPLIVHVSNISMVEELIKHKELLKNESYIKLMDAFWPGPLTIIFEKSEGVCREATAGLDTVGIRMPGNKTALSLIEAAGTGIAAPSANISGRPSPTLPEHVIADMDGKADVILNAGKCRVGVESTVLDMTRKTPVILRPGGISRAEIEKVLGRPVLMAGPDPQNIPKAPGMKYRHYAPNGKIFIFQGEKDIVTDTINKRVESALASNIKPLVLASEQTFCYYKKECSIVWGNKDIPESFAQNLYAVLRYCDKAGAELIFVEALTGSGIVEAVMNRLIKASGNNIINVPPERYMCT